MRVENFTNRARMNIGSVVLVTLMLALSPVIGFGQSYPCCPTTSAAFTSIGACGTGVTLTSFNDCSATTSGYAVPTTADGAMDSLTIDLSGQVCYDADGNAVSPSNPQNGELIQWTHFSVPAFSGTFGIQVDNDETISWAIYHVANPACLDVNGTDDDIDGAAGFTFVQCGTNITASGTNSAVSDTIDVTAVGNLGATGYYYLGVWDSSSDGNNATTDDITLETATEVNIYNNCGEDMLCNVSITNFTVTDNFDNTYFLCVDFTGFNSAYTISDPAALTALPTFGSGTAPSYPDTICLGNPLDGDNMNTMGTLCLLYNDDVPFTGATISAVSEAGCNQPENISDCIAFVVAPPATNFTLDCTASCFSATTAPSLDNLPAPLDAAALMGGTCSAITGVATGTTVTVTSSDIITPIAGGGFTVTRLYCVTDPGVLPGSADDETECCTQTITVAAQGNDPSCTLSCNDLIQISLDQNCEALVTPDMMLEGDNTTGTCDYYLSDYVGQTIKVSVFLGDNSCWGEVIVEDKIKPQITDCNGPNATILIGCNESEPFFDPIRDVGATDNCGLPLELIVVGNVLDDKGCEGIVATREITYFLRDSKVLFTRSTSKEQIYCATRILRIMKV